MVRSAMSWSISVAGGPEKWVEVKFISVAVMINQTPRAR